MAEKIISFVSTSSDKLPDLVIKDAQLIFVKDTQKIALDMNGTRKFYNDIELLDSESVRTSLDASNGRFYFVTTTGILWFYQDKWVQLTSTSENYVSILDDLPSTGKEDQLYINKNKHNISIWDNETYVTVGEVTSAIPIEVIDNLFS